MPRLANTRRAFDAAAMSSLTILLCSDTVTRVGEVLFGDGFSWRVPAPLTKPFLYYWQALPTEVALETPSDEHGEDGDGGPVGLFACPGGGLRHLGGADAGMRVGGGRGAMGNQWHRSHRHRGSPDCLWYGRQRKVHPLCDARTCRKMTPET